MAGTGPPPKPQKLGRNKTDLAKAAEAYDEDSPGGTAPRIAAPELPNPKRWLSATRDWWDAWTRSSQTAVFEPTEWEALKSLLSLVDAYHRDTKMSPLTRAKLFDHIRKAERELGATHMERLRARITTGGDGPGGAVGQREQGQETPEGVAVLDEYREMFS